MMSIAKLPVRDSSKLPRATKPSASVPLPRFSANDKFSNADTTTVYVPAVKLAVSVESLQAPSLNVPGGQSPSSLLATNVANGPEPANSETDGSNPPGGI